MFENKQLSWDALATLHRKILRCRKCRLSRTRRHAVPGEGPSNAKIMFVGEAPGENEDQEGRPFCGRSGLFLDKLFDSAGIRRQEVYITSSVKCRPPGNRDPKSDELETCGEAWLERQIEIIKPHLIVLLGRVALSQMLGETRALGEFQGKILERNGLKILPTYHPAAGMRFPVPAQKMKSDFRIIRRVVSANTSDLSAGKL